MTAKPCFIANMLVQWEKFPKVVSNQDVGGPHPFYPSSTWEPSARCAPEVCFSPRHKIRFSSFFQVAMQAELKTMDQKVTALLQWVQEGKVTGPQGYFLSGPMGQ